jgi:hypothetical protein
LKWIIFHFTGHTSLGKFTFHNLSSQCFMSDIMRSCLSNAVAVSRTVCKRME